MSETIIKVGKDKNSNKQKQKQTDTNFNPEPNIDQFTYDKGYDLTDNGRVPTPSHLSDSMSAVEDSETDIGNKWDKWELYQTGQKSGGRQSED